MPDILAFSSFLQYRLCNEGRHEVSAVDAAAWLDRAGLLTDSATRPGLPLRRILRKLRDEGELDLIAGAWQDGGRWWRIASLEQSVSPSRDAEPRRSRARAALTPPKGLPESVVTVEDARAGGFRGFMAVGEILEKGLPPSDAWLNRSGVYLVCAPPGFRPEFIVPDKALDNVTRPKSVEILEKEWVDGVEVLYIGAAGVGRNSRATLRKRLNQMLRHAQGRATNHVGGQILWQLRGFEKLLICWHATEPPPAPRNLESSLLHAFERSRGNCPFANLTG